MTAANGLLFAAVTHPYFLGQNTTADVLMVVNGNSQIGKCLLWDAHIHVASPSKEIAKLFQSNFFVVGARRILNKLQFNCVPC